MYRISLKQLLSEAHKNGASDLHLSSGLPPAVRIDGDIVYYDLPALSNDDCHSLLGEVMDDDQMKGYLDSGDADFATEIEGVARFRVNALNSRRGAGAVFRTIPSHVLTMKQLGLGEVFRKLASRPRGLVLVTGPTGSGKSTTMAAMLDYYNTTKKGHILTVEDPVEFVHEPKSCIVTHREVGCDTASFSSALRAALREDPDCILVGEMRDIETISLALTAAETGHLVLGTLHTNSAAKTVDRIIDVFPASEKEMVRAMLAESLQGVVSQTLLKKKGGGRVAAHEIMVVDNSIRNLIKENKIAQMYSQIQTSGKIGSQTMDDSLKKLVENGVVEQEEARKKARDPDRF